MTRSVRPQSVIHLVIRQNADESWVWALTRAGRVIDGDTCDTEEQARAQAVKSLALRNKAAFSDLT